jgi:endoglucanase
MTALYDKRQNEVQNVFIDILKLKKIRKLTPNLKMNKIYQKQSMRLLLTLILFLFSLSVSAQGLKASGKLLLDDKGNEVLLRGMGLGGWMLQEPYMMEMTGFAGTQWQIKAKIESLIGTGNMEAFYDAWHANHCTRRDIDSLASWGFNSVRLPMHFNLFTLPVEDEPFAGSNTWLTKGFAMTDSLISWCKANHMYVILDLHAAPGGQGKDAAISDADPSKKTLWESDANKMKTIALWRKLAERYANEPWVGGYDLINEPNWSFTTGGNQNGCSENSNIPLRQLYVDITNAIRQVDKKHIIIIEGNCWGNNYNGILPVWDNNMVLSFHKYWSNNDQGSIAGIVGIRDSYNIPIWMGESGENSNAWFTDAIQLVEKNDIGWAWWPLKKINSIVNPMTIVKTANYQTLLNYWNGSGTAPSVSFATNALMEMAENAKIENCIFRKDVIDAMFRQVKDSATMPYSSHHIPGGIAACDFDLGRIGKAYSDKDFADYHVSSGTNTRWNSGYTYRNDGVDIAGSYDAGLASNVNYIGWIEDNEWVQYTVEVDSTAAYTLKFRYASYDASSKIRILINNADVSGSVSLPSTGGQFIWGNLNINNLVLYKGSQKVRIVFEKGGANFDYLEFALQKKTEDVQLLAVSAETYGQTELIYLNCNKILDGSTVALNNFSCTVNGNPVSISSLTVNADNPLQVIISLGQPIFDIDDIRISYTGGLASSPDGTLLQDFSNLQVRNNLPVYTSIPGKIEAEAFTFNQGLQLETTSDAGGGQNIGYTSTGDYLEYKVRVAKTSKYLFEVRYACLNAAGRIEVQQLNANGAVINSVQMNIPVTGGWQTWQTASTTINLAAGICTLRVKILQPEFNLNWYNFTESSAGISDKANTAFSMYPNPASNEVSILFPNSIRQKKTIILRSAGGILMKRTEATAMEESKKISVGDLPRGLYIVEVEMDGRFYRNKLILQ